MIPGSKLERLLGTRAEADLAEKRGLSSEATDTLTSAHLQLQLLHELVEQACSLQSRSRDMKLFNGRGPFSAPVHIDLMASKDDSSLAAAAAPVAKKVFTIAHKSKKEENNKKEQKEQELTNKPVKPKNSKKKEVMESTHVANTEKPDTSKDTANAKDNSILNAKDNEAKSSTRRKRKPKTPTPKAAPVDQLSSEVKDLTLNSPVLSAEAAPFIPNDHLIRTPAKSSTRKPVSRPKPKTEKDGDLRGVEIKQLQIRFSPTGFTMKKKAEDDSVTINCVMPITDPDFAYDLESIRLEIGLPRAYPGTKSSPIRPTFSLLNSDIPSAIIGRIERNLKWGLNSLEGGVLVCRPMLRYLEDNLEKWMVDDVRESAFKFVKPSEIKVTQKCEESGDSESAESESEDEDEDYMDPQSKLQQSQQSQISTQSNSRYSRGDWIAPPPVTDQSSVGGIAYTLKLIFSTVRGIDLLTSQKLTFLACCDRCKFNFPVEELRPFVDRIEHCPKCTNQTKFYYKSQLVTPGADFEDGDGDEYEGLLGCVRFLRAKPVDLLPSLYQCACSRCFGSEEGGNESSSSSCKIEKVKIGENISYSCFNCHQKIRFQIDRIEWQEADIISGSSVNKTKAKTKVSGHTLTVGNPLPLNGACEHYKKSFRWYRFPCCGQAFPCDECHAKDPVAKDHPVEWANRFICGFCSREQSISVKECPECGKNTSASGRKFTAFWEGGKGARNQILMSRKDSKKYKDYGTSTKTITKKKSS